MGQVQCVAEERILKLGDEVRAPAFGQVPADKNLFTFGGSENFGGVAVFDTDFHFAAAVNDPGRHIIFEVLVGAIGEAKNIRLDRDARFVADDNPVQVGLGDIGSDVAEIVDTYHFTGYPVGLQDWVLEAYQPARVSSHFRAYLGDRHARGQSCRNRSHNISAMKGVADFLQKQLSVFNRIHIDRLSTL